jgi:hypothetical protein
VKIPSGSGTTSTIYDCLGRGASLLASAKGAG